MIISDQKEKLVFSYSSNLFKHFVFLCICLTLNYHTFNLNFIHLHVTLMVCFKADFLLRTLKCHLETPMHTSGQCWTHSIYTHFLYLLSSLKKQGGINYLPAVSPVVFSTVFPAHVEQLRAAL